MSFHNQRMCYEVNTKTFTTVYLSAVTGITHNTSQEAGTIAITLNLEPVCPNPNPYVALSPNISDLDKLQNLFYASISSSVK